jgi:hypothetical protein
MCNLLERHCPTPEHLAHKLGVLRRHCDAVGRDYDAIVRSHTINPLVLAPDADRLGAKVESLPTLLRAFSGLRAETPRQLVAYYRAMAKAGVQSIVPYLARWDDVETLELLADEVIPQFE